MKAPLVQLGEICKPKQWKTLSKKEMSADGYPVYGANGRIGFNETYTHEDPVILVGCRGSCGTVHVTEPMSYANGNAMALDELDESRANIGFLEKYLRFRGFRDIISGTSQPQIIRANIIKLEVPLPPLAEQNRIAGILDAADALRAKRRESLAQLDTLLQSTFLDMFGDPVTNPKKWDECAVGDVTDCIVPGRDKPKSFTGSIPWITTDDLVDFGVTSVSPKGIGLRPEEIAEVRARVIPKGSVIISCVGDLGISSIAGRDLVVNQQLHTFQCGDRINAEFLTFCLPFRKPWMKRRATQTTLPYLNKTNCNSIPIVVPPLDLQQRFAAIVESVEQQKTSQRDHLNELDTLFASLQSRVFRGDL